MAGIIVGITVMILTVCIVVGFKQTVTNKLAGFDAHIQVVSFETNDSYDLSPIEVSDSLLVQLRSFPHVTAASPFITKPGMLKTDSAFHGIVLKGTEYWSFFEDNRVEGVIPSEPQQVLLSRLVANRLQLHVGDPVPCYFIEEKDVRARKLTISGIYDSGFEQYDELFVLTPLETMRSLQKWDSTTYSGIDILVDDVRNIESAYDDIYFATVNHIDENGYNCYFVQNLYEKNPKIFLWLDLLDMNVVLIIILMLIVAGMNMVTGLIILILESVQLIGTLKALGANNRFIRRIFLTQASMLIVKGLLWGNILGLTLAAIQYFGHVIPLESATYYVNTVPVAFPWMWIVLLNAVTMALCMLVLLLPSMIISNIHPAKVMHFE
ncbi:MAG: ABC transporter permease [Paludibacteraceae bacterium]|nr:ABC transporter permease [Paludibacteraceae bacterium]